MQFDEEDCISVQFLLNPFNRIVEEDGHFEEKDAFPPPSKPYFKGSDVIRNDIPTKWIRKRIASVLAPKQVSGEEFAGNMHVSDLHFHEKLLDEVDGAIADKDFIRTDTHSFSSFPVFYPSTYILPTPSSNFVLFKGSGFYNGDVFEFLKHPVNVAFDIVETLSLHYS